MNIIVPIQMDLFIMHRHWTPQVSTPSDISLHIVTYLEHLELQYNSLNGQVVERMPLEL